MGEIKITEKSTKAQILEAYNHESFYGMAAGTRIGGQLLILVWFFDQQMP